MKTKTISAEPVHVNLFEVIFIQNNERVHSLSELINNVEFGYRNSEVYLNISLLLNITENDKSYLNIEKDLYNLNKFDLKIDQHDKQDSIFKTRYFEDCTITNTDVFEYNLSYDELAGVKKLDLIISYKNYKLKYY